MPASVTGTDLLSLFTRLSAGDEGAFTAIYEHYEPRLRVYLLPFTEASESDVSEIIQEIFIRLWFRKEMLMAIQHFDAYIFRMARNVLIDRRRKRSRYLKVLSESADTTPYTPVEDAILLREYKELAREAIRKLSPQKKTIFLLRQEEGLSLDQIAERLQISKFAVKKQLYDAVGQVREYLRTHGEIPVLVLTWLTDQWLR